MKIWELSNGILTHLNEEEDALITNLIHNELYALNERELMVAQALVSKSVLVREEDDNNEKFKINYKKDVWRD